MRFSDPPAGSLRVRSYWHLELWLLISKVPLLRIVNLFLVMAVVLVLSNEQKVEAIKKGGCEFKFLLDEEGVDEELQAMLFHFGVTTTRLYSVFAKDEGEFCDVLKEHFGLDRMENFLVRIRVSKALLAYNMAKTRVTKVGEAECERDAKRLPKGLSIADSDMMRRAFEEKWWDLEDDLVPSKAYLEKKLSEVETGQYKAELLSEVVGTPTMSQKIRGSTSAVPRCTPSRRTLKSCTSASRSWEPLGS